MKIKALKIISFIMILSFIILHVNEFFDLNDPFYDEQKNTIDTIFLGSSVTEMGISPLELYAEYGICSYNIGSMGQPVMASYYMLQDVYNMHSDTLKTVVLDVSSLRYDTDYVCFLCAIEQLCVSKIKYDALYDYTEDFNKSITYMIPLFYFHNNWTKLKESDFNDVEEISARGYKYSTRKLIDELLVKDSAEYNYVLDENAVASALSKESLGYLDKILAFCEENSLELILIRTPSPSRWNSSAHNAIQEAADKRNIEFIDFNFEPYVSEISYDVLQDSTDANHLNYWGAKKFTSWIGNYLIENNYSTSVSSDEKYFFMDEQLNTYYEDIEQSESSTEE